MRIPARASVRWPKKAEWIRDGFTDADWDAYKEMLQGYKLDRYLEIFQQYLDEYYK